MKGDGVSIRAGIYMMVGREVDGKVMERGRGKEMAPPRTPSLWKNVVWADSKSDFAKNFALNFAVNFAVDFVLILL